METMEITTPENRPLAPGVLGRLQEFLNSGHLEGRSPLTPEETALIRARAEAGENHASLVREFGVPQAFIAAIARGAPIFDELDSPDAAARWLAERGFVEPGQRIDGAALARLHELRELLRDFAAANNNHPLPPRSLGSLQAIARSEPLVVEFAASGEPGLAPAKGSPLARIVAAVFDAMRDGSWARLKRCPGLGCPFTFYDASRNRTGTWCSMSVCGNRTKVRKYQQRHRKPTPVK